MREKADTGPIFIATHMSYGIALVKLIKDAGMKNLILLPDSFSSQTFPEAFKKYPKERLRPGFYTSGMYVTSPLIFDTANEKAWMFKEAFEKRYGESPEWDAAFSYDTAMLIVAAIKATGIEGKPEDIKEDRKKIRDHLANLNRAEIALHGTTGLNFFDEIGNSPKPVSIGMFSNGSIISSLVQLQRIRDINEIARFDGYVEQGKILYIDGQYMYKTNVTYTGIKINKIKNIDFDDHTVNLDFFLWFRFRDGYDAHNIEFVNAAEPIRLGSPITKKISDRSIYFLYHVKGLFKFGTLDVPVNLGEHVLGIGFRHNTMTRNNLIYVTDIMGMGLAPNKNMTQMLKAAKVLSPKHHWEVDRAGFFQQTAEKASFGNPEYLKVRGGEIKFSQFNMGIWIKERGFTLRKKLALRVVTPLMIVSIIMLVFLSLVSYHKTLKSFIRITWFFQIFFAFCMLLSTEVFLLNWIMGSGKTAHPDTVEKVFDILWWAVPAFLFNIWVARFIWMPLERRAQRPVPNIVRLLVSFIVYVMAFFGIVAFVFDQKITGLLATSGVIAMIIGLAIQINISNIFSGIAINLERLFRVDDWIKVGDYDEGKVLDITWRTTRIKTRHENILYIPNSIVAESIVHNFSDPGYTYEMWFRVHVDAAHPPHQVEKIIKDAVLSADGILKDPAPNSRFTGFSEWAANYIVLAYTKDYGRKNVLRSNVWKRIWTHLHRAGIEYALQRQQIHLFQGVEERGDKAIEPSVLLQETDIFQPFSDQAKATMIRQMETHHYLPGETIVKQGEPGESIFIIVEGVVAVSGEKAADKSVHIARLGAGDVFGEMSLLTGAPRSVTVTSITDTRLFEINKSAILPLLEDDPSISGPLSEVLTKRQLDLETKMKQDQISVEEKKSMFKRTSDEIGSVHQTF